MKVVGELYSFSQGFLDQRPCADINSDQKRIYAGKKDDELVIG